MRIFQYVSGQSSELSVANHTELTANCIAAKTCLRPYIKLIWESPTTQDKNLHLHKRSFHSKLESNGVKADHNHKFSEDIFSTLAILNAMSKLFGSQGCSDDKNWLDFSSIFFKICRVRCKFSFHEERRSSQAWQWRDFPEPITILCHA